MKQEKEQDWSHLYKMIADKITEAGGYLNYNQFDELLSHMYLPHGTFAGWGDFATFKNNQKVYWAHKAVDAGYLINTGNGYRVLATPTADQKGK